MTRTDDGGCGCLVDAAASTPAPLNPAPRLSRLPYRVGTHGAFLAAMLAGISRHTALRRLATRDRSDPAIALLDSWAVVLDVLAFYQEQIANEGFLRTATERRSVLELSRTIGYELAPGVSAGTYLAFSCDDMPGSPPSVSVPQGVKVQSVPGDNELPQTFETSQDLIAYPEFNDLRAETAHYVAPVAGDTTIYLDGTATRLKAGDALLIVGDERVKSSASPRWQFCKVARLKEVPLDVENKVPVHTIVELDKPLGPASQMPLQAPRVYALRQRTNLFGFNAPDWRTLPVSLRIGEIDPRPAQTLVTHGAKTLSTAAKSQKASAPPSEQAHAPRPQQDAVIQTAAAAGPAFLEGPYAGKESSWAEALFAATETHVHLDQVYDAFVAGGWVVLRNQNGDARLFHVDGAIEVAKTDYTLSYKVTRLDVAGPDINLFSPRHTTAFGASELLPWGRKPITDPVSGTTVTLLETVAGLKPGQLVALTGTDIDTGLAVSRILTILAVDSVPAAGDPQLQDAPAGTTRITFTTAIAERLDPKTVRINANVVAATHGETRDEVIGGGDGATAFQTVRLPQKPLTYVSAPTHNGRASTLEIRVNNILWQQVPDVLNQGPKELVYTTRLADDGTVTIGFGDGVTGARPPSGRSNIKAHYRKGTGLSGLLKAGQLTQPLTRPLGLKGATNPLATTGAEDPEAAADAKRNAPLTVRTMGRIVSLDDVEDFASGFAGIGKALAVSLWNRDRHIIQLTVAAADGRTIGSDDAVYLNLVTAVDRVRHAAQPIRIDGHDDRRFGLDAKVKVEANRVDADVLAAVKSALISAFSFPQRGFAQTVSASEVLALMQKVPGVAAVFLEHLCRVYAVAKGSDEAILAADLPFFDEAGNFHKAELLTIDPDLINLTVASP